MFKGDLAGLDFKLYHYRRATGRAVARYRTH